ncbi:hypothetical protein KP509_18G023300 [Ceratopteris richardii]|uniref:Uncharacterized protein n=1 Tax=Ceratopteris richardii TaxID=49495 RepID=A0A8T2SRU1_CERRI|nr:hypothetical protein KP509_18G023300 [Ceratopteris richardii]
MPSSSSSENKMKELKRNLSLLYLTDEEYAHLEQFLTTYHTHSIGPGECTDIVVQRIKAPIDVVWSVVRRFDEPQAYKNFVKSCQMVPGCDGGPVAVGSVREVRVVSGLPASYSHERLELLDDENHVLSFRVLGGEHRLHNYRSTTSLHEFAGSDSHCGLNAHNGENRSVSTVVIESYVAAVPEGNTVEDTVTFINTVVRCNLHSLARLSERLASAGSIKHDDGENSALRSSSTAAMGK